MRAYLLAMLLIASSVDACVTIDKEKGTYTIDKSGCVSR
jgi:hypothetical protein